MKVNKNYYLNSLTSACVMLTLLCVMPQNVMAEERVNKQVYVSTEGSDMYDGTQDKPFATLSKALSHVRTLRQADIDDVLGEVHIILREGTYYLTSTLQLTSDDSGSSVSPTVIECADGEKVTISGGSVIDGWQDAGDVAGLPEVAKVNVWAANVPFIDGETALFRQMWVGDNKMRRANTFDSKTLPRLISVDKTAGTLTVPCIAQTFSHSEEVEMTIIQDWVTNVLRVRSLTSYGKSSVLSFEQPETRIEFKRPWPILRADATSSTNHHFYLSNAIELLNQPQEWYCDRNTGQL